MDNNKEWARFKLGKGESIEIETDSDNDVFHTVSANDDGTIQINSTKVLAGVFKQGIPVSKVRKLNQSSEGEKVKLEYSDEFKLPDLLEKLNQLGIIEVGRNSNNNVIYRILPSSYATKLGRDSNNNLNYDMTPDEYARKIYRGEKGPTGSEGRKQFTQQEKKEIIHLVNRAVSDLRSSLGEIEEAVTKLEKK